MAKQETNLATVNTLFTSFFFYHEVSNKRQTNKNRCIYANTTSVWYCGADLNPQRQVKVTVMDITCSDWSIDTKRVLPADSLMDVSPSWHSGCGRV